MKKRVLFLAFSVFFAIDSFSQKDFTFCYGSISVTMFGGGNAEMVRYNSSGSIVSRVTGTFDLYDKGNPTEVLKIQFQGKEYRYDLIRDGYGNPSKIFDNQGREYNLCKTTKSSTSNFDYEAESKIQIKRREESDKSFIDEIKKLLSNYKKGMKPDDVIRAFHDFTDLSNTYRIDMLSITGKASYNELKKFYDKAEIEIIKRTIGKPISIDHLLVAQNDLPEYILIQMLGEGWRLPTPSELNLLYLNKNIIGGFSGGGYWSSFDRDKDYSLFQNFDNGKQNFDLHFGRKNIRTVKTDPQYEIKKRIKFDLIKKSIIVEPIIIDHLLVAKIDFPEVMKWDDAKKACEALGEGWRLPTIDELKFLYLNKNEIRGFGDRSYWSSTQSPTEFDVNFRWYLNKYGNESYGNMKSANSVRAVRTIK